MGAFVMLEGKVSVDFKVRGQALDGLKGDVIQGSSVFHAAIGTLAPSAQDR